MSPDFMKMCRVCLGDGSPLFDMFTSFSAKRNTLYSQMISECTKIQPTENDGLPRHICRECVRRLKRAHAFCITCERSDHELRRRIVLSNSSLDGINSNNQNQTEDSKFELVVKLEEVKEEPTSQVSLCNGAKPGLKEEEKKRRDSEDNAFDDWDAEDDIALTDIKEENESKDMKWIEEDKEQPQLQMRNHSKKDTVQKEVSIDPKKQPITKIRHHRKKGVRGAGESEREGGKGREGKEAHQCDVCGKFLSTRSNLKAHKICHTELRPYRCDTCGATFRGYSALYQHGKTHTGAQPYHCHFCPKRFSRRTGLVNHVRAHTQHRPFACTLCMKTFVQSAQLSVHLRRHNGDKPYLCQDCGKGFPIRSDLRVHQRTHNGEKPYECSQCPKRFATSGNLAIHKRIHTKEIRHSCGECGRGFVTSSAYRVHVKRHRGEREHGCDCGKTFYTSSALKQHKLTHSGERPHACAHPNCARRFTQTSHLRRHERKDHPPLPPPPPLIPRPTSL